MVSREKPKWQITTTSVFLDMLKYDIQVLFIQVIQKDITDSILDT